jgi:hypothetical protein
MNVPEDEISLTEQHRQKGWKGVWTVYYPILLAFLIQQIVYFLATTGLPFSIFHAFDFVRSDSGLYLDIAKNGYELFPCHERFSGYASTSTEWCGNAGWMPLYAWLIKPFLWMGCNAFSTGFWISRMCFLTVLFFIFELTKNAPKNTCLITMLLAAIFPSSIYYGAVFPISLMLLLLLGSFYFWHKNMLIGACLCGLLLPLSYSTGFVGAIPWAGLAVTLYIRKNKLFKPASKVAGSIILGYLVFFVIQQISTGHWNAFFLIQTKYGHGFHNIIEPIVRMVKSIFLSGINDNWQNIQSLFFILMIFVITYKNFREKELTVLFTNFCFIAFAAFPILIGSNLLAQYRSEALLLPLVIFLGRHPKTAAVVTPLFIFVSISCAIDFFISRIS